MRRITLGIGLLAVALGSSALGREASVPEGPQRSLSKIQDDLNKALAAGRLADAAQFLKEYRLASSPPPPLFEGLVIRNESSHEALVKIWGWPIDGDFDATDDPGDLKNVNCPRLHNGLEVVVASDSPPVRLIGKRPRWFCHGPDTAHGDPATGVDLDQGKQFAGISRVKTTVTANAKDGTVDLLCTAFEDTGTHYRRAFKRKVANPAEEYEYLTLVIEDAPNNEVTISLHGWSNSGRMGDVDTLEATAAVVLN